MNELVSKNFVFAGRVQVQSGGTGVRVFVMLGDGKLEPKSRVFKSKRKSWVIGGVYTDAEFSDTQVSGLENAKYTGMWGDHDAVLGWQAVTEAADAAEASAKLEKDARLKKPIDVAMLPLRRIYWAAIERGDRAQAMAISQSITAALNTPIRSYE